MYWYLAAIATASLLGSLHCVGMCGPLALWASGSAEASRLRGGVASAAYHLGRGVCYTLVGLAGGLLGRTVEWGGAWFGVQLWAAQAAGGLMIALGVYQLANHYAVRALVGRRFAVLRNFLFRRSAASPGDGPTESIRRKVRGGPLDSADEASAGGLPQGRLPRPSGIARLLISLRPTVFRLPIEIRGWCVGLLTALLPCGWLYVFAVVAMGTGSAFRGALVMAAFWLGTIPLLVGVVVGTRLVTDRLRTLAPVVVALVMIVGGAMTVARRGMIAPQAMSDLQAAAAADIDVTAVGSRNGAAADDAGRRGSWADGATAASQSPSFEEPSCPHCAVADVPDAMGEVSGNCRLEWSFSSFWRFVRGVRSEPLPCCSDGTAPPSESFHASHCSDGGL